VFTSCTDLVIDMLNTLTASGGWAINHVILEHIVHEVCHEPEGWPVERSESDDTLLDAATYRAVRTVMGSVDDYFLRTAQEISQCASCGGSERLA